MESMIPQDQDASAGADACGGVKERLTTCLRQTYFPLRAVQCEYYQGVVVLRGRVPSFFLKQIAQALVTRSIEVKRVVNLLEVQ
jgi:hypothetical protein